MWCSTRSRAESAGQVGMPPLTPVLTLALGLALGAPALASNPEPGSPPGTRITAVPGAGHPQLPGSRLQGQATLRFFGLRVYHARLWTLPEFRASQPAAQPLVLELEYLRQLKGSAIAERSLQEMQRAGPIPEAQARHWLAEMQKIFPDVKSGDRITGQHLPGQGARFWLNGQPVGQVDDADFARRFFGIWLAPTTSEPDMRLALLGQEGGAGR